MTKKRNTYTTWFKQFKITFSAKQISEQSTWNVKFKFSFTALRHIKLSNPFGRNNNRICNEHLYKAPISFTYLNHSTFMFPFVSFCTHDSLYLSLKGIGLLAHSLSVLRSRSTDKIGYYLFLVCIGSLCSFL